MTNFESLILSIILGLTVGISITTAINVKAIKEHTETFYAYKIEMDELALDVWCKPSNNAQEQVNCIRENIYFKAK